MDFYTECEKRKIQHIRAIGEIAYRRQQASVQIEEAGWLIRELDIQIAGHEEAVAEIDRAQRNFNTYLAVKEGALTTDQLAAGIMAGTKTDIENGGN